MTATDQNTAEVIASMSEDIRAGSPLMRPIEIVASLLLVTVVGLLFGGVVSRYVFAYPVIWIEEAASISFLWLAMLGSAIALDRNEHLRLTIMLKKLTPVWRDRLEATSLVAVAAFLIALLPSAIEYAMEEWYITSAALHIPNTWRVSAIPFGFLLMTLLVLQYLLRNHRLADIGFGIAIVVGIGAAMWLASPVLISMGAGSLLIFLLLLVPACLLGGVPIAFCFGLGTLTYLLFGSHVPVYVMMGRMDEGMSSIILLSVPIFVLLGCVLDATGMGKAIVDFLGSLIGHVKAGMSYVLLGSLFIVSGISGSKVSDMATVAPALFPEMKRRGNKPPEMIALLATGAAMADTVPPSIVLIVLGSVAGVSIAGLFTSGIVVAAVLLAVLIGLARWKARHEITGSFRRAPFAMMMKLLVIAAPALVLPFLIRSSVASGIATATEVSTIAVLYAMAIGMVLYGGISWKKFCDMLLETAALTGAILMILGTALAMAWVITQAGVAQSLAQMMQSLPGGWIGFMLVTIVIFLILGCVLEGLPAIVLMAPLMFPIARSLGIHDIHYAMVVVVAMNIGLMAPPIGVGFYLACKIGDVPPDEAFRAIWPYIFALIGGLLVIAAVPAISIGFL
ncbi:TRAP transporter large permease subunit [Pseudomonas sp. GX19020]|uniref:TRAP transporter large permease n=1 Tax=Pseudomonas sp. GX19020 TaxID=2942277 RepID=UPI0020196EAA|nr:TRAP transporter large permease subunit [Pseudomonas sp. GX19020]MCL4068105.1 TRAP transporter large permease subunit [Pseudomonas sp. GX19020]